MELILRVDVKALKKKWQEDRKEYMLDVLALCGFDDDLLNEISGGQWFMRKRLIGKKIEVSKRGIEWRYKESL